MGDEGPVMYWPLECEDIFRTEDIGEVADELLASGRDDGVYEVDVVRVLPRKFLVVIGQDNGDMKCWSFDTREEADEVYQRNRHD